MSKLAAIRRVAAVVGLTAAGIIGTASLSAAAPATVLYDWPAGVACEFPLKVETTGESSEYKELPGKNGDLRLLLAGKGLPLTFTNTATGESLSLKANGAVQHVTLHPDGSSTFVLTGHNVIFLFPTDTPAGPSTTLHVGRVEFTATPPNNDFTIQNVSGTTTDLCAALT